MDFISIFLIAIALAMDAFSVSLSNGFSLKNITKMQTLWFGVFFGAFQAFMPLIGYFAGSQLQWIVSTLAPWIAFILLVLIGANMIRESLFSSDELDTNVFSFKQLTLLAIATSIDAFAIGVTFAVLKTDILIPVIVIGVVAFLFSIVGIILGKTLGDFFGDKFEIVGGIILILLGFKILLESFGILFF